MQHTDSSTATLVRRMAGTYLRPYIRRLGLALFFMLVAAAMTAAFAKLMEPLFDHIFVNKQQHLIVPVALTVFVCFLIRGGATYIYKLVMNTIGQSIVADIQRDLFSNFLDLDLKFFHDNPSGQLVSRVISDVNVMRLTVTDVLTGIGVNLFTLILLVSLMFYQDTKLALIACLVFPFAGGFMAWVGRRLRKISKRVQSEMATLTDTLTQIFQGIRQVKASNTEDYERKRAGGAITGVRNLIIKSVRISALSSPFHDCIAGFAVMALIIYGGNQIFAGELTVGSLTSFMVAFGLAYEPIKRLTKLNSTLQIGLGAGERVFEMLDRQAEIVDCPDAVELKTKKPEIIFENVSFRYGFDDGYALKDVSFTLASGKVTALVGPSGSGKTTAMNLLPRLYDVGEGKIMIDGTDIRDVTLKSLRENIALVSQDITIFDDSVKANIAYGNPDATEKQIIKAAKAAAADEFIRELPEGYDTKMGEHGVKLSGGQRQRIAIARAVLRNAPILLLDEATSALDMEAEKAIQQSLAKLQKGRTTLIIAHRLSTIRDADQIITLDAGRIVEKGDHGELLESDGLYARMHGVGAG